MTQDIFGQPISLDAGPALDSWNAMQLAFMAHSAATPTHLAATLSAAPGFALAHAVKGMFHILLGRREFIATAAEAAEAARAALAIAPATQREIALVGALDDWLAGRVRETLATFERLLAANPGDTLVVKLDHALRFVLGDSLGMRRMIEQALPAHGPDHPGRGYVLGCHAFALEETGAFELAHSTGHRALKLCPDDAWGLHAVAHVHDMTADAQGGLDWLAGREGAWAHCNNFRFHVWWHKALMHLDLGQTDAVLALYDDEIRKDKTDDYRDISNATSLLMRLELDGVKVGDRWGELADLSEDRTEDGCLIFADLHYMLALVSDDRTDAVTTLMGRLHRDARAQSSYMHRAMAQPGLSAAAGLVAFGDGKYDIAFLNLARARKTMQQAGGSHAQRDVFERLTIDSAIRSGFLDEAETILTDRTAHRAGREDGYAAVRRQLIARGRDAACAGRVPAE
jgi:tetratricopeptide (TPR) repeat protein